MNQEVLFSIVAGVKLLILAFIGFWYSLCGRGVVKGWLGRRRVILPLILCVSLLMSMIVMQTFTMLLLAAVGLTWLIYYGTMSIGYGADSWLRKVFGKVLQQIIVGALQGGSCIVIAAVLHKYWMFGLSMLIPAITLGILGSVGDQEINAAYKEALVGMSIFSTAMFLI